MRELMDQLKRQGIWFLAAGMLVCSWAWGKEPAMAASSNLEKATFAGGCFWCTESLFEKVKGVKEVTSGYTGGHKENPTYQQVSSGTTGHAEAVEILFDPKEVSYAELLDIFLKNIDPTAKDAQFVDEGSQYRTAVFYHNEEQKRLAEEAIKNLQASGKFDKPVVTAIVAASHFYPAEDYHQDYYKTNTFHYKMYEAASGRHQFLDKVWGKDRKKPQ
jgi:methionine-S-sulfoxide reductase